MFLTPWLATLAPLVYLAAALSRFGVAATNRIAIAASWASLVAASGSLVGALVLGPAATPTVGVAGLGLSVRVDALSAVVCSLVGFIGLIVVGYSRNYLAGDPGQRRFMTQLCLTLGLLQALVLSGNLGQLVACWVAASLCVNRLLLFRGERQAAVLAARKRFVVARLADLALIGAAALLWRSAGTGDIGAILSAAKGGIGADGALAAVLLALAAIFSCAQLPFHGWILEVMETPTPVSALLHAGVVNAGGFLVLRFADVVGAAPHALMLLTVIGAASAVFGSLVMLPQTSVKVALAYSTIAQMGFMLLECGLGAYSAALLHIVAHGLYKAHAFLSAGGVAAGPKKTPTIHPAAWLAPPVLMAIATAILVRLGDGPLQRPGVYVLSAVMLLGIARAWMARPTGTGLAAAALVTAVLAPAYGIGQSLFAGLIGDLGPAAGPSLPQVIAAIAIVAAMTGLLCLQLRAPARTTSVGWARAYALVAHGLHLNTIANRLVLQFWPAAPSRRDHTGATA